MNTNQSGNWKNPFENHISTPAKAEAKATENLKSRENEYLKDGVLQELIAEMETAVKPDKIYAHENIALIATVGHGMAKNVGTSARLFKALSEAGINVNMIDQGSSELNIIVGVEDKDYADCLKAIYNEFFKE